MKYFGFLIVLLVTLVLAVGLSVNIGQVPPLGYLLDPYHGFWQNSYSEDEKAKDEINLDGLSAPVEVIYDENLIPHLFAQNDKDLMLAQGFVTAQHRLWQMEFQTRAAAGRISEIVGRQAIDFDRMQRRKGLGYGAEMGLQFLTDNSPETLELIEAYSKGVNLYIEQLNIAEMPVEYKILDYRPEKWSAYKTVLLLKYMADMLVGDKDIEYTNLRAELGESTMNKLFPDYTEDNDPVIEADHVWDFQPLEIKKPAGLEYPDFSILIEPIPSPEPGVGSNNWAVDGSKTRSGNPILANDPHLGLNLPSLWYVMQLSTPEYTVKGATLPGALGVISGFNENIAWGVTNATRDVRDWYAIEFKDKSRLEYRYNDQWIQSTLRLESIEVKGDSAFMDTVIYTHYGPVMYDRTFKSNDQKLNFALKWTAHEGSNEQKTFLLLNKAKSHRDYLAALDNFTSPAQNFVFAAKNGDIAMKVQGKFPLKWPEQGKYLMDGNNPSFEWSGYIPSNQNPSTLNPERGFVSSANQYSVGKDYPYYVFDNSFEHYRNRRINSLLQSKDNITLEDMKVMQFDDYDLHAAEVLPIMMRYLQEDSTKVFNEDAQMLIDSLSNWDFYADPDVTGPTIFSIWWSKLKAGIWSKLDQKGKSIVYPNNYITSRFIVDYPLDSVFDDPSTSAKLETAKEQIQSSFEATVEEWGRLSKEGKELSWSKYKHTNIQHLVPNFKAFSYDSVHTGGGRSIINATSERHGASWRMLVELGENVKAQGIYPGGQSGNPGSRFYANMIDKWAKGEYLNMNLNFRDEMESALFITVLNPN
ncbi:penicillin acylase family protein [Echinicola sp. CAU 1574]|uniref:Penicillin acylase family protein n=1 Tax=Echinicola arenosa TaxID=2774144 RepID=A0ABR9AMS4_9BACT|nr:penicillin acylase family protein [Echinicola arenosa]MBD8490108.1 penicillin acylase family protein [Echinicola arenosa]